MYVLSKETRPNSQGNETVVTAMRLVKRFEAIRR